MDNEHLKYGLRPPAQAPPHRGLCPGGRARWLGEIAECGIKTPNSLWARGHSGPEAELGTPNSKGMTLIEVILVMVIIGILSAVVVTKLDIGMTTSRASVDGAAYMIASDIRYAQECAMANRVTKTIRFTAGQSYYTFPATTPSTSGLDPSGQLASLKVTIGTTIDFTFNSLGEPTAGGGSSVTVSGGGQTKTISVVNYTGKVNIP